MNKNEIAHKKEEFQKAKQNAMLAAGLVLGPIGIAGVALGNALDKNDKENFPIMREDYFDDNYNLPYMIQIVDDEDYIHKKFFGAAIGCDCSPNQIKTLKIFDEFLPECGLIFEPTAACGSIYYADPNDRKRFINVDLFYEKLLEKKMAELGDIAFCLGAKSYSIEMAEESVNGKKIKAKGNAGAKVKVVDADAGANFSQAATSKVSRKLVTRTEFKTSREPTCPQLVWYKNDDNIKNLIRHAIQSNGGLARQEIVIEGSKIANMTIAQAADVDIAVKKLGGKLGHSLEREAIQEHNSKFYFNIEF